MGFYSWTYHRYGIFAGRIMKGINHFRAPGKFLSRRRRRTGYTIYKLMCTFAAHVNCNILISMDHPAKHPSALLSFAPVVVLVSLLFFTIRIFGSDALNGGSQIVLLMSTAICTLIAVLHCRVKWKSIEKAIIGNITSVATALLILLLIGADRKSVV